LSNCAQQIQEIAHDVYHRTILSELQNQKKLLYHQLKSWNFEQSQLDEPSNLSSLHNASPSTKRLDSMYNAAKQDIASVLHIDSAAFNAQHDISKLLYKAIRNEVEHQINHNDPFLMAITPTPSSPSLGVSDSEDIDSPQRIVDRIASCRVICEWQQVRCWMVEDGKWKDLSPKTMDLILYQHHESSAQYLVFTDSRKEDVWSFQPVVDGALSEIEHPDNNPCAVIWNSSDWCHSKRHFTFCAKFGTETESVVFTKHLHEALAADRTLRTVMRSKTHRGSAFIDDEDEDDVKGSEVDSKEEFFGPVVQREDEEKAPLSNTKKRTRRKRGKKKKDRTNSGDFSEGQLPRFRKQELRIGELEAEVQRLSARCVELEELNDLKLTEDRKDSKYSKDSKEADSTKRKEMEMEIAERMKLKETEFNERKAEWESKVNELEQRSVGLEQQKSALVDHNRALEGRVSALKKEASGWSKERETMKADNVKLCIELKRWIGTVESLKKERVSKKDSEKMKKEFMAKIRDLQRECDQKQSTNDELEAERERLTESNNELTASNEEMTVQLADLRVRRKEWLEERHSIKAALQRENRNVVEWTRKSKDVEAENERLREQLEVIKAKLSAFERGSQSQNGKETVDWNDANGSASNKKSKSKWEWTVNGDGAGNAKDYKDPKDRMQRTSSTSTEHRFDDEALLRTASSSTELRDESLPITPSSVSSRSKSRSRTAGDAQSVPMLMESWESKKVRVWNLEKAKWMVLSKNTTTNVHEVDSALIISVEDRSPNMGGKVLLKHKLPSMEDSKMVLDAKKKTCQWYVAEDMARNECGMAVMVSFKSLSDLERFANMIRDA